MATFRRASVHQYPSAPPLFSTGLCQYPGAWTVLFNNDRTENTLYTVQGKACLEFRQLHWKSTVKSSCTPLILVPAAPPADLAKGFTESLPAAACTDRQGNTDPTLLHPQPRWPRRALPRSQATPRGATVLISGKVAFQEAWFSENQNITFPSKPRDNDKYSVTSPL